MLDPINRSLCLLFAAESKFSRELSLEAMARAVPLSTIKAVLAEQGVRGWRERKLNALLTVLLVIAMNLYTQLSIGHVMKKIAQGLRYVWPDPDYEAWPLHSCHHGAHVPIRAWSSAKCRTSISNGLSITTGLNPNARSRRQWPLFERYCV